MNNLFCRLYKKHYNDKNYFIICIDRQLAWDTELKGKEPKYDNFIEFLSSLVFELTLKNNIYIYISQIKKIKDKNHLIKILKNIKSFGQWLFIIVNPKRRKKIMGFSPFYLQLENIYEYNPKSIEHLDALFYLEIGVKYMEIQSLKFEEEHIIQILLKQSNNFNYNIIFEDGI